MILFKLNFTYKLRKSKDLNWGAQSADGSWNGMIKELLLEEQDMGNFEANIFSKFAFSK